MKTNKQLVGKNGEEEARSFLIGEGHRILRTNWRASHLELDIISLKDRVLHIIEVKTRSGDNPLPPEINVTANKRSRMVRAAQAFVHSPDCSSFSFDEIQFDVLTVVFSSFGPQLEYFPAAFIPIYTSTRP